MSKEQGFAIRAAAFRFCLLFQFVFASAAERHIALLVRANYKGELQFAYRVQAACENLRWQADILNIADTPQEDENYDFIINLVPGSVKSKKFPHYLAIFHPLHHYFKTNGKLKKSYSRYDGYLLTYSPDPNDINFSVQKLPYISWYPTVQMYEYQEVDPTHLFHLCCHWGNRYNDPKMQRFLGLLDQEDFMRFYGDHTAKLLCPQRYCSPLPFERDAVCNAIKSAGVALVLHSDDHNTYGQPSGRIFEAAAASSVIISDQNPFVKEHFGDTVLYIDTDTNAETIFDQVKGHMQWIHSHKTEALEKAKAAHAIYKNRFLLEDQLLRLGAFHDQSLKHRLYSLFHKSVRWIKTLQSKFVRFASRIFSKKALVDPVPCAILRNRDYQYSLINSVDFHPRKQMFCAT